MTGRSVAARASAEGEHELVQVRKGLEHDDVDAAFEQAVDLLPERGPHFGVGMSGPPRAGEPSGPTEPPTSASRPLTSRASRASWAARRLSGPTRASRPQAASRNRFAPNESVSISSAPASMYSRWAVTTSSGRVATSSSRQARWGTPRLKRSVPIPPSTRSGRAARRSRNRWRGEAAGYVARSVNFGRVLTGKEWKDPSCPEGSRGSSLIVQDAPARNWHLAEPLSVGCRGFNGPVPPPLLIRNSSVVRYMVPDGAPLGKWRAPRVRSLRSGLDSQPLEVADRQRSVARPR